MSNDAIKEMVNKQFVYENFDTNKQLKINSFFFFFSHK